MKKNLTLISLMLGVMLVLMVSGVSAARVVDDVTLNGGTNVVVSSGDDVTTEVTVTTSPNSPTSSNDWESTGYLIEGQTEVCVDTDDYTFGAGTFSESFMITIPGLSPGDYNFEVKAYQNPNCVSPSSNTFNLVDAITVVLPSCDVTVTLPGYPISGWYNSPVDVHWEYSQACVINPDQKVNLAKDSSLKYNLIYYGDTATRDYIWDSTNDLEEGTNYQLCVDTDTVGGPNVDGCSEEFNVDTTNPVLIEEDRVCNEGETITLTATATDYGGSGIDASSWEWDLDNDGIFGESGENGQNVDYDCVDGPALETVKVKVSDVAGNSAGEDVEITVNNVVPTCSIDSATADAPLIDGIASTSFSGSATDPSVPDTNAGFTFTWNFGDGNSMNGASVEHNYTTADTYTVNLTAEDKDGGVSVVCQTVVQVIEPTPLTDQEVAAFYPLDADFGYENNKFMHGLSGYSENCEEFIGPANLLVLDDGGENFCTIKWDRSLTANPTNAERGNHFVVVRVYNNTEVEYYSFDIMVYSWIIPLEEEWNLISIPLTAEDSKATKVFDYNTVGADIDSIWSYEYNSETGESEWMCVKPTSSVGSSCGTGITKLTTVEPGRAYWVKLKDDVNSVVVKGMGISPDEVQGGPMLPPSVDVPTNAWSLIGRYGIVGIPYYPAQSDDKRVHGYLPENAALDSLTWLDNLNDMHVYNEDFTIVDTLYNNEGYWLWVEVNVPDSPEVLSYAPIDSWYPKNSGLSL